jgi:hypothetical protein
MFTTFLDALLTRTTIIYYHVVNNGNGKYVAGVNYTKDGTRDSTADALVAT